MLSVENKFILRKALKFTAVMFILSIVLRVLTGFGMPQFLTSNLAVILLAVVVFYLTVYKDASLTADVKKKIIIWGAIMSIITISATWFILALISFAYLGSQLP